MAEQDVKEPSKEPSKEVAETKTETGAAEDTAGSASTPALAAIRRGAYMACVLLLAVVAGVTGYRHLMAPQPGGPSTAQQGQPAIGGPFSLTSHTGERITETSFPGSHTLIFFGYTFCPDVCPTTLQEVSGALDTLGPLAEKVQPLFVTVDPERDDQEAMADYVQHFHPKIVGLTGSVDDVTSAAKAYRVYFAKVPEWKYLGLDGPDPDNPEDPGAYLMDHSSVVYLMGPDGRFIDHLGANMDATQMAERLKVHLGS